MHNAATWKMSPTMTKIKGSNVFVIANIAESASKNGQVRSSQNNDNTRKVPFKKRGNE